MRLSELNPKWTSPAYLADGVDIRTGMVFDCPCRKQKIAVTFRNPIEVKMPKLEKHPNFHWPEYPQGWYRISENFETMTLNPSIAGGDGHWHGSIINGQLVTASACSHMES